MHLQNQEMFRVTFAESSKNDEDSSPNPSPPRNLSPSSQTSLPSYTPTANDQVNSPASLEDKASVCELSQSLSGATGGHQRQKHSSSLLANPQISVQPVGLNDASPF